MASSKLVRLPISLALFETQVTLHLKKFLNSFCIRLLANLSFNMHLSSLQPIEVFNSAIVLSKISIHALLQNIFLYEKSYFIFIFAPGNS